MRVGRGGSQVGLEQAHELSLDFSHFLQASLSCQRSSRSQLPKPHGPAVYGRNRSPRFQLPFPSEGRARSPRPFRSPLALSAHLARPVASDPTSLQMSVRCLKADRLGGPAPPAHEPEAQVISGHASWQTN